MPTKKKKIEYTLVRYQPESVSNFSRNNACLLQGAITPGQIKTIMDCLDEGKYFVPEQVGFPCERSSTWSGDRKMFCVLTEDSFSPYTPESDAIFTPTVIDIVGRFKEAKGKWDGAPMRYQITPYGQDPCIMASGHQNGYPYVVAYSGATPVAYIGIPKEHPLYKKTEYQMSHLPCHGDVTWLSRKLPDWIECDLQADRWIGWDYDCGNDLCINRVTKKTSIPGHVWKLSEIMEDVKAMSTCMHYLHASKPVRKQR